MEPPRLKRAIAYPLMVLLAAGIIYESNVRREFYNAMQIRQGVEKELRYHVGESDRRMGISFHDVNDFAEKAGVPPESVIDINLDRFPTDQLTGMLEEYRKGDRNALDPNAPE